MKKSTLRVETKTRVILKMSKEEFIMLHTLLTYVDHDVLPVSMDDFYNELCDELSEIILKETKPC